MKFRQLCQEIATGGVNGWAEKIIAVLTPLAMT